LYIGKRFDYQHSEETKQKIGAGNKGKVMTEVARKKMSESAKNRQTRNKAAMLL